MVGLAAENLSSTRRLGPTQLGGPDRQSPSVSAEAENQAPAPTTPDSAPFSRRLSDRGSFPIAHKTNSSVSLRGLLPVSPPPFSSGRRLNAAAAPPSRIFFCPREKRPPRRSQNRPHIGEDSPKFYSTQAPLRSTIQLSSPHVEIFIVLWRSFRIREKRYLLPTKADPPEITVTQQHLTPRIYLLILFLLLPQPSPPLSPTTTTHHHLSPSTLVDFVRPRGHQSAAPSQRQSAAPS